MASVRIPEIFNKGISSLVLMDPRAFEELQIALNSAPVGIYDTTAIEKLVPLVKLTPRDRLAEIVKALFGLQAGYLASDVPQSNFISDVASTFVSEREEGKQLSVEDLDKLKDRLSKLMAAPVLAVGVKAHSVLFEHDRNFSESRILSDIRPVFGDKPSDPPIGAVLVHSLKITYVQGDEYKDFFVAMDSLDLQSLIDSLVRAQVKVKSLGSLFEKTNIHIIEPK